MKRMIFILILPIIFSGCSLYHIHSEDISSEFYPSKKTAGEVSVLEEITQPHEVIGYVTVNAERNQELWEVLEKLQREAAILGADAITNIKSDATGDWKKLPAQKFIGNAYIRANYQATAVVFK